MEEPMGKYGKLHAQILAVGLLSCLTSDQLCLFTCSVSEQPLQALWRLLLYQSGGFYQAEGEETETQVPGVGNSFKT